MAPRVLIVDDDPDMLELLRQALSDAGYATVSAANGNEALQMAKRSPPDVVVLDLLLPDMNGFSVCEQLRLSPATASVPVLMITVLPGQFPRMVGVEVGADAYLNKPFRTEELVSCVGDLLCGAGAVSEVGADSEQFPVAPHGPGTFLRLGTPP